MTISDEWLNKNLSLVKQSRKCQRNWDHSKTIPKNHIQHFIDVATNSPTKQDESYYDLYVISNREILHDLYWNHSWGFVQEDDVQYRNPQVDASVFLVWARKLPETNRNAWVDNSLKHSQPFSRVWTNAMAAIGISSGMVALTAHHLGYVTGFNKNFFQQPGSYTQWMKVLGHKEPCHPDASNDYQYGKSDPEWVCPYSGRDTTIVHGLGIGFPNNELQWYQSRDNQYMTSDPNDDVHGEVDELSMPGIVQQATDNIIEFGPWSHDVNSQQSIDRQHNVKWIM